MTTTSPAQRPGHLTGASLAHVSDELLEKARANTETVVRELESRLGGLTQAEADSRLKQYGLNEIAREKRQPALMRLLSKHQESIGPPAHGARRAVLFDR
jgi:Mg2+-importing ATPase